MEKPKSLAQLKKECIEREDAYRRAINMGKK